MRHQYPVETYGVSFNLPDRKTSFIVDTRYFLDLLECYKDSHILVMNVVRKASHESAKVMHLCIDDVKHILSKIKPKKAVLTHFGMTMLKAKPCELAKKLSDELGVEVVAASDGMTIELEEKE